MRAEARLAEPEELEFAWDTPYTRDRWIDQLLTHSDHAALPPDRRQRLLDAVSTVLDEQGGSFVMHYRACLISAARR